jgi:hypothetical protein
VIREVIHRTDLRRGSEEPCGLSAPSSLSRADVDVDKWAVGGRSPPPFYAEATRRRFVPSAAAIQLIDLSREKITASGEMPHDLEPARDAQTVPFSEFVASR